MAAKGKEPKYVKPADKVSAEEGSNAFFFLDIVGDPIPTVTWFKVRVVYFQYFYIFIVHCDLMFSVPKTWLLSPGARAGLMAQARSSSASRRSSRRMRESTGAATLGFYSDFIFFYTLFFSQM